MADGEDEETNEIVAAAIHAKDRKSAAEARPDEGKGWPLATIGLGIGSAALAAALIYANRGGKKKG